MKLAKSTSTKHSPSPTASLDCRFSQLDIEEDNKQCSNCGMFFKDDESDEQSEYRFWVCCDECDEWYCFSCHNLTDIMKSTIVQSVYKHPCELIML